ncbi:MAG: hypothetical protein ACLT64_07480 [Streptococcus salivarius]
MVVQLSIAHLLADAIIHVERNPLSPLFELHLPSEQIKLVIVGIQSG